MEAALPVRLRLAGPQATDVARWLEGEAGWQPIGPDTETLVAPRLEIADIAGLVGADRSGDLPLVLFVLGTDDPLVVARTAAEASPQLVLRWPDDRRALLSTEIADPLPRPAVPELTLGGGAGGAGTTTVSMAVAGLNAWAMTDTLLVARGFVPGVDAAAVPAADLAGPGTWGAATPVPGVGHLRVMRTVGPGRRGVVDPGPAGLVVHDVGVDVDADVLVVRCDAAGRDAIEHTSAGTVVLVAHGPLPPARLRAATGRATVVLPWSRRVARAAVTGHLPAGAPGTWLALLGPLLSPSTGTGSAFPTGPPDAP